MTILAERMFWTLSATSATVVRLVWPVLTWIEIHWLVGFLAGLVVGCGLYARFRVGRV